MFAAPASPARSHQARHLRATLPTISFPTAHKSSYRALCFNNKNINQHHVTIPAAGADL